jgi:hypothetical protein
LLTGRKLTGSTSNCALRREERSNVWGPASALCRPAASELASTAPAVYEEPVGSATGERCRAHRGSQQRGGGQLSARPRRAAQDAAKMEAWAGGLGGAEALKPAEDGDEVQKGLAGIAARAAAGDWLYTKFFAIGLFRLLELTGAKDPKALEALVRAVGAPPDNVNRDLMTYKVRAPGARARGAAEEAGRHHSAQ